MLNTFQRSQQAFVPTAQGFWHPLKLVVSSRFDRALRSFVYQNEVDRNLYLAIRINVFYCRVMIVEYYIYLYKIIAILYDLL